MKVCREQEHNFYQNLWKSCSGSKVYLKVLDFPWISKQFISAMPWGFHKLLLPNKCKHLVLGNLCKLQRLSQIIMQQCMWLFH